MPDYMELSARNLICRPFDAIEGSIFLRMIRQQSLWADPSYSLLACTRQLPVHGAT